MLDQGYSSERLLEHDDWKQSQGHRGYGQGDVLQPSWNQELASDQQHYWDEDEEEQSRPEQQLEVLQAQQDYHNSQKPVEEEEERPFEDPFLQHKGWFREVMKP
jgi:hypothetical protein